MGRRVAVVGGGTVGVSASLELARRGATVTLFERNELASGATGRAAGICYDAYVDPRDGSFAARSLTRFRELDVLTEQPYLWFARDETTGEAIESHVAGMQAAGRDVSMLDPATVAERFPELVTGGITTAAIARNAGYVDTDRYVEATAAQAKRAGVTVRTRRHATVTGPNTVVVDDTCHSFDAVLVAAGGATNRVLAETEFDPAVGLYRTQVLTATPATDQSTGRLPMFYDATGEWYARPTADGVLAGDGSAMYDGPPDDYSRETDEGFRTERLAALGQRVDWPVELTDSWAGLCTATPDGEPLVGECLPDLFVATGFCGHGFMRSPAIGETLAEQILEGSTVPGLEPTRFDGSEQIDLPVGVTE